VHRIVRAIALASVIAVVSLVGALVPGGGPGPAAATGSRPALGPPHAADVHGEDEKDRYVGTGGLILPGTIGRATRREVAGCEGCQWRLTTPCVESSAGVAFPGQAVCQSIVRGCPQGGELLRTWFRQPAEPWREIGLICLGDEGPVTTRQVRQRAMDRFVADLPPVRVTFDPPRGVLAQLPVVFSSGQEGGVLQRHYVLMGQSVTVQARPVWRWEFGDGVSLVTLDPGGAYPNTGVAHAYRRAGAQAVRLTTSWSASFDVGDLGPFPIPEPVDQHAALEVAVGEGRAVLAVPG
jgi:hypothetical protein